MRRFDARALYDAMETQRAALWMSGGEVAVGIGVSEATIRRTRSGGRMEVDGMLAMVGRLGVPVERFVRRSGR